MMEKLENLLQEWEVYNNAKEDIPPRILNKEKLSISKAVKLTVEKMEVQEYSKYKKEVEEILSFLEVASSTV